MAASDSQLSDLTGQPLLPGSLNLLLAAPLRLVNTRALELTGGNGWLWPATLNGEPVWLYRWPHAPLHVVEVMASVNLRQHWSLADDSVVTLELAAANIESLPLWQRVLWSMLWAGRRSWYYSGDRYPEVVRSFSRRAGLTQQEGLMTKLGSTLRAQLGKSATARSVLRWVRRNITKKLRRRPQRPDYARFQREQPETGEVQQYQLGQLGNLLNYTKISGETFAADKFAAGYHTLEINGVTLAGQRNPAARLAQVPYDFDGKLVLDIGSNQGGMLLALADRLRGGVGIDHDHRMVNVANRIAAVRRCHELDFYLFDLQAEPLDLILDLVPEPEIDIVFLLSVCMWISNWQKVVQFAASVAPAMLFESNGSATQQAQQIAFLSTCYSCVEQVAAASTDDPSQQNRQLFLCFR